MKMLKKKILIISTLLLISSAYAQIKDKKKVLDNSNVIELKRLEKKFTESSISKQNRLKKLAQINNWNYIIVDKENNKISQLYDVSENNTPIYRTTFNHNASISTRTNFLNSGGGLNLNLNGANMLIGLWDGGVVRDDHIEFSEGPFSTTSRVNNMDNVSPDFHATHVAGTMIARGSNPDAKGMAPEANINSYDWNNDMGEVNSEITTNGLLISNHSYGVPVFDEDTEQIQVPNSWPGKYRQEARNWDLIHYNAPYYLMVVSAGNEGSLSYSGSLGTNRDKLIGEKNSKNNLVIANAQDAIINAQGDLVSVTINESSSQGPTDDRRIKPDITGNGTGLISTSNTGIQDYAQATGTSMSAPNVTGSLILLQEYYNDLYNSFMRSSTLKGIALHTADDAGRPGPDEVFGWGLLNSKKAAETIAQTTSSVEELTLSQGQTITRTVTANGLEELKASITWTDVPGQVADNNLNSSTPILVNDLDIRVTRNSDTYLPWRLDFFNPTGDAVKADNNVDNVERVDVENTVANAEYTVTITHKGSLTNSSQDFALIITGIDGTLNAEKFTKNIFSIYPNPANNKLNIQFNQSISGDNLQLSIIDMLGRTVSKQQELSIETYNNTSIDVSSLDKGTYFINLTNGNSTITKKFIKE